MLAEREVIHHIALDFEQELQMAAQSSVLKKSYGLPVGQEQVVSVSLGFVNSLDWVSSFFTSTLSYNPLQCGTSSQETVSHLGPTFTKGDGKKKR